MIPSGYPSRTLSVSRHARCVFPDPANSDQGENRSRSQEVLRDSKIRVSADEACSWRWFASHSSRYGRRHGSVGSRFLDHGIADRKG